jgi:hypothetical protein
MVTVVNGDGSRWLPVLQRFIPPAPLRLAGWPTLCQDRWKELTTDRLVISTIVHGLTLPFLKKAPPPQVLPQHRLSAAHISVLSNKYKELAERGILRRATRQFLVSPQFVVEQADKDREIFDGTFLNSFLHYAHFKMDSLATARHLARAGDWAIKIDLSKMYNTFAMHPAHRKYVQIFWPGTGEVWEYWGAPFGLTHLPRLMTRIMKTVARWIRRKGFRCVVYIDDFLILDQDWSKLNLFSQELQVLFFELGLAVNLQKSVLVPTRTLVFLGMEFRLELGTIALPERKIASTCRLMKNAVGSGTMTMREVAKIQGILVAASPAIPTMRHRSNNLRSWLRAMQRARHRWSDVLRIPLEVAQELSQWAAQLREWNGTTIIPREATHFLEIDASSSRFGVLDATNNQAWSIAWSEKELLELITSNRRELASILNEVRQRARSATLRHGMVLEVHSDNSTAVSYVNNQGGRIPELDQVAQSIWAMVLKHQCWIQARYLPGRFQVASDPLSRGREMHLDWALLTPTFRRITAKWGTPEVDLFATRETAQVPKFVSWQPDPLAVGTDAFSLRWSQLGALVYLNPPFSLIARAVAKIAAELSETVFLLVTPEWRGAHWINAVIQLSTDWPMQLGDLCSAARSSGASTVQDLTSRQLICWRLCAKRSLQADKLREQLKSVWLLS